MRRSQPVGVGEREGVGVQVGVNVARGVAVAVLVGNGVGVAGGGRVDKGEGVKEGLRVGIAAAVPVDTTAFVSVAWATESGALVQAVRKSQSRRANITFGRFVRSGRK